MGSIIMSASVIAIGIAIGLARGGSLDAVRSVRPRWWGLLLGGFAMHAVAENIDVWGARSLAVIGMFSMVVALAANAHIRGALIAAFGLVLNLVVLVLNGAVPLRLEALREAGLIDASTQRAEITSVGHLLELESADTTFGSLGDVIPIAALDSVISIGDLVTFAGVIVIVANLVASRRRGTLDVEAIFAPAPPPEPAVASAEVAVLDLAHDSPVIDVTEPAPVELPVAVDAAPIDLTFDPDDLWADDDTGVRILGPSPKSNS